MKSKIKIYLCDLVHNYLGTGSYMFPLNIGYLAAYTKKFFPEDVDIKLFKYPHDFINQFKKDVPDVVGFSHYTWNADLNKRLSRWIKSASPKTLIVFGGPNVNYSLCGYKRFFNSYDSTDFYIPYEGENPFVNLLREIFDRGLDVLALKRKPIDGVVFYNRNNDLVIQGQSLQPIKELDTIPSPYLTGLLDEFFDTSLIPTMETNRGCPYTCTFCAQGLSSHNRLDFFGLERVKDDIKYIARKVKNTNILHVADANFGIAERDIEISKYIAKIREEANYPRKFNSNWAKNQPKLFEIAKILTNCTLGISLQSLDKEVLRNVKRSNIKLSVFKDIIDRINAADGISATEVILGLPGETKQSHIQTLRQLFDWDISYIVCYNALILEGTEMSLDREKGEFKGKTKFRLIDNSFGKYDTAVSFEAEEGIRSTPTISEEDILYFRPVHWLIYFLWNYRFCFDLLKYLQSLHINPLDYILKLIDNANGDFAPQKVKNIFDDFKRDSRMEWFETPKALRDYYSRPEQIASLKEGRYGKLNGIYIYRVLLDAKEDFLQYLYHIALDYSGLCESKRKVFDDIFSFLSAAVIDFSGEGDEFFNSRTLNCNYDILRWRSSGYKEDLEGLFCPQGVKYDFYLPGEQKQSIRTLLEQYQHTNKNVTLRKMSEWMDIRDFFYRVEPASEDSKLWVKV